MSSYRARDALQGLAVLLPVARSVTTTAVTGVTSTILLTTSTEGYGETDLAGVLATGRAPKDDRDTPGPVSLAVATQPEGDKEDGRRLLAVGNSLFLANNQLENAGNLNLGLNAVNWLVRREEALGIAPRQPEQVQLVLSQQQMTAVWVLSIVVLPLAAIVFGVTVWWRRRR